MGRPRKSTQVPLNPTVDNPAYISPLDNPSEKPKVKRKYTKKNTKKKPKKIKVPVFKTDAEYMQYVANFERERLKQLLAGGGGPVVGGQILSFDSPNIFKADQKIDKKIKKTRGPRRPKVNMLKKNCPRCNKIVELPDYIACEYNFDLSNKDSTLPYYACGNCGPGGR